MFFYYLKQILNWLFPYKCIVCETETPLNGIFCHKCFSQITFIENPICKICGKMLDTNAYDELICEECSKNSKNFDMARSLFYYEKPAKNIIMKIKNKGDSNIANICCKMIVSKYNDILKDFDFIVSVPSHWIRNLKRGFNPPDIIAFELSKFLKIKHIKALKRYKKTEFQKNKTKKDRINNVKNAFLCNTNLLKDKNIILVDDVFTTGSTLNECSKILKKDGGVNKIICITIAFTPL